MSSVLKSMTIAASSLQKVATPLAAIAIALTTGAITQVPASAQATIDTRTGGTLGTVGDFGNPEMSVYGQIITPTASQTNLQNFTFYTRLTNGSPYTFAGYVMQWNSAANRATGPVLFQSGTQTPSAGGTFSPTTMNTGGIALTAGQPYVLFFSTLNPATGTYFNGTTGRTIWQSVDNIYANGSFVFLNANSFSQLSTSSWLPLPNLDLAMVVNFGATPVPFPFAPLPGLAIAWGSWAIRRSRQKLTAKEVESPVA